MLRSINVALLLASSILCGWTAVVQADQFELETQHALPVQGQSCELTITSASKATIADATFFVSWNGQKRTRLQPKPIHPSATSATIKWKPCRTGKCRLSATVRFLDPSGKQQTSESTSVDLFVTSRRLHFHYWQCSEDQRYVTSLLENSKDGSASVRWKKRGVQPLGWKGGQWHWAHGYNSAKKIGKLWTEVQNERTGIVIDEFGGGDKTDQQLGIGIQLARKKRPKMFIAAYCLSVAGDQMIKGLSQADLVLVETYTYDWRWDGFITGRWQTAQKSGLEDSSVAVLGIGSQWIGTERELRRVFEMMRARLPTMPGIGFFPDIPRRLSPAVDSAIEDYFLKAVVKAEVNGKRYSISNIGESVGKNIRVQFRDASNKPIGQKTISQLEPWLVYDSALPVGASTVQIVADNDRYTALNYAPPLTKRPFNKAQLKDIDQFIAKAKRGVESDPLARVNRMTIHRTKASKDPKKQIEHVKAATIPFKSTNGRAFTFTFDLLPKRCWFYGINSISLVGEGELSLSWSRGDHDAGIEANQSRPTFGFKGKDKYAVREVPTIGFVEGKTHRIVLSFDGKESVRAIIFDDTREVAWDSGPLPAKGGFSCSQIRLGVNPFERSEISWNDKTSQLFLRGGAGAKDSPYYLETLLSNLKMIVRSQ